MTEPRESTPWDVSRDAARRLGHAGPPHGRAGSVRADGDGVVSPLRVKASLTMCRNASRSGTRTSR
jgi:hypothetical protein